MTAFRHILCASTGSAILAGTGYGVYKIVTSKAYTYNEDQEEYDQEFYEALDRTQINQIYQQKSKIKIGGYLAVTAVTGIMTVDFVNNYVKDVRNAKSYCNIIGKSMLYQPMILYTFVGCLGGLFLTLVECCEMSKYK